MVPGDGIVVDRAFVARQLDELNVVAELIRELYDDGVAASNIIAAGRGRWPFPEACLVDAVARGFAARASETRA